MKLSILTITIIAQSIISSVIASDGITARTLKGSKSTKSKKSTLYACIGTYPGYTGDLSVSGSVKVTYNNMDLTFKYDLEGGAADCERCGIHIHTGTTCDDADLVGGHYWAPATAKDPWTTLGVAIYGTDESGDGKGSYDLNAGLAIEENVGHAVVVHDAAGVPYGCGLLSTKKPKKC